jgi:hypothetical protein
MSEEDWNQGVPCDRHEEPWCSPCRPGKYDGYPTTVYITQGWSNKFHISLECTALASGQAVVQRNGGTLAPVVAVSIAKAHEKHDACNTCFPSKSK